MVDEEILKIKIEAEDDASSVLKKVDKNLEKFNNDADKVKYLKSQIASFTAQCKGANEETRKLAKSLNATLRTKRQQILSQKLPTDVIKAQLPTNVSEEPTVQAKGRILSYDAKKHTLQTEQILKNNKRIVRTYKDVVKEGRKFNGILTSEKHLTKSKTSSGGDGAGRIKRIFQSIIAFRLASASINLFLNSFRQGVEAIKQSGGELSKPFVELQKATMGIKISLSTIIIPLVQTLTGLLDPLANDLINVANAIAYNNAVTQGQSEYYKLSKEKIDEYTESLNKANNQLTQLDKFASLSGKKSYILGEIVSIDPNTEEGQKNIAEAEALNNIYTEAITTIKNLTFVLQGLLDLITLIGDKGSGIGGSLLLIIYSFLSPIGKVIALFKSFSTLMSDASIGSKLLAGAVLTLTTAFIGLAIAKEFAKGHIVKAMAIGALAGGAITAATIGISGISSYYKSLDSEESSYNNATSNSSVGSQFASDTTNYSNKNLNIQLILDGKTFANATAPYMGEALSKWNLR